MPKPQKKKLTPQERLFRELDGLKPYGDCLPLLLPPQLWPFVETLARLVLVDGKKENKDLVAQFAITCRQQALYLLGYDTLECFALAKLLKESRAGWQPKAPRVDAITYINNAPHKPHRLSAEQEGAAHNILDVWAAFGKFLEIAGRGIGGGGGNRAQALGPVDVMGQELWNHHRDIFKPWAAKAAVTVVERRTKVGQHLTIAAVAFKVLVEDVYPEELDSAYALVKGTSLKALKAGLDAYHAPERLDAWGRPPVNLPAKGSNLAPGGQTAPGGAGVAPQAPKPSPGLWQAPKPKLPPDGKVKLGPRKKIAKEA